MTKATEMVLAYALRLNKVPTQSPVTSTSARDEFLALEKLKERRNDLLRHFLRFASRAKRSMEYITKFIFGATKHYNRTNVNVEIVLKVATRIPGDL